METLTIKLKQHTPLIHFQHDQDGATLRASEVKPRLDKYLLSAIGEEYYNDISDDEFEIVATEFERKHPGIAFDDALGWEKQVFEVGKYIAKKNNWFANTKDDHIALNYKLRIQEEGKKYSHKITIINADKWAVFIESISLTFLCRNELLNYFKHNITSFFAVNNFGFRQSKGYGSFSVESIIENGCNLPSEFIYINQLESLKKHFAHVTAFRMKFPNSISVNLNDYFQRKVKLRNNDQRDLDKKVQLKKATSLNVSVNGICFNADSAFADYQSEIRSGIINRIQELKHNGFQAIADYRNAIIEGLSECLSISMIQSINNEFQYSFFKGILEQHINNKYQLYKSGRNYPYTKSKLRNFWGELNNNDEVVYWDKRYIKQKINGLPTDARDGLSLKCCTNHHRNECELYISDGDVTYYLIRALLGLEGSFEFQTENSEKKFVVSVNNPDIERFQSVIMFIVKNKTIYTCIKSKNELKRILNRRFILKMTIKDERHGNSSEPIELGELSTPDLTDEQIETLYNNIFHYFHA